MGGSLLVGLLIVSLGGILNGSFAFPMGRIKRWDWENIWLSYAFFGFVLIPTVVVAFSFPGFLDVYRQLPQRILLVLLFGHLWGWGATAFGLGVNRLGMSLAFALILGTTTLVGALVPLLIAENAGIRILPFISGLALLVAGIGLFGLAGHWREQDKAGASVSAGGDNSYFSGVLICLLSGFLSSSLNIGVSTAEPIQRLAEAGGASGWAAGNVFWPALLFGGFLANLAYCGSLLKSNQTLSKFRLGGWSEWGGSFLMGAAWISGILLYGYGAFELGTQGPVLGWPIFMSFVILTAYILGVVAGEWEGVQGRSRRMMKAALVTMVIALFVIARSG